MIIGDEISRNPEVRRAVAQTRTEQVVRFLGFVPFETLREFYANASVFAFPSLYEGFGLAAARSDGHRHSGGDVVRQFAAGGRRRRGDDRQPGKRLRYRARHSRSTCRGRLTDRSSSRSGYDQVRQFSWRRTAEQTLDVYREVAAPQLARRPFIKRGHQVRARPHILRQRSGSQAVLAAIPTDASAQSSEIK